MKTALLVIDVQDAFARRDSWRYNSNPELIPHINRLIDTARAAGDPVVWVLHSEPGTGGVFDPRSGFVRPMAGLTPADGELMVTKTSHNAFTTTNLQQQLTAAGVPGVTVTGIRTEQCCETTARVASDLGYRTTYVTDATATTPLEHWSRPAGRPIAQVLADPLTLSTTDVVSRTEYVLAGRFATICTTAELTGLALAPAAPVGAS